MRGSTKAPSSPCSGWKPVWDSSGRVTGTRPIPGKRLGRPRIDVLVNPSGLYRDLFPDKLLWLDEAIQKAALQTDIENIIADNNRKVEKALLAQGMSPEQARSQSRLRIFTEKPGSYGNWRLRADRSLRVLGV